MPKASEHKAKAESNLRFLGTINVDEYPDWAAVVAFYTAVHFVEGVRAKAAEGHSQNHDDRLTYVANRHNKIHTNYHILQNVSMLARYQSRGDFFTQFQPADVSTIVVGRHLAAVIAYCQATGV